MVIHFRFKPLVILGLLAVLANLAMLYFWASPILYKLAAIICATCEFIFRVVPVEAIQTFVAIVETNTKPLWDWAAFLAPYPPNDLDVQRLVSVAAAFGLTMTYFLVRRLLRRLVRGKALKSEGGRKS